MLEPMACPRDREGYSGSAALEHFHSFCTAVLTSPEPVAPAILSPVSAFAIIRRPIRFRAATGKERVLQYLRKCPGLKFSRRFLTCERTQSDSRAWALRRRPRTDFPAMRFTGRWKAPAAGSGLRQPAARCALLNPELVAWIADSRRGVQVTVFDSSDEVRSRTGSFEFSPNVARSADGKLWFLPGDGVSVIDPQHLPVNKLQSPCT
jgi:hypothetical protein